MIILEQKVAKEYIEYQGKTYRCRDSLPKYRYELPDAIHFGECVQNAGNEVIMVKTNTEYRYYIRKNEPNNPA